ncbi:Rv3235 family protein [Streptomyces sp. 7N604]|uniref:Rv3235 family protein n=1 Tax=Streptomyces sp. 7N604 TaxID=3457415 RepID=UPI003FD46835
MDHSRSRPSGRTTDRRASDRRAGDRRAADRRATDERAVGRHGPGRGPAATAGAAPPRRRDARRPGGPRPSGAGAAAAAGPVGAAAAAALRRRELERHPRYWFANRLLLILSGQKPVHWMLGHTLGAAYDQLVQLAPLAPLRPGATAGGGRTAPVVARCGEYRPAPGVIEAFARILSGDRLTALAFRLERCRDDRWRCSAVELGGLTQRLTGVT